MRHLAAVLLVVGATACVAPGGTVPTAAGPPTAGATATVPTAGKPPAPAPVPPGPASTPPGRAALRAEPPRVEAARGALSPSQAAAAVERAQRGAPTELLSRHVQATDKLVDAPLKTGNGARILIDGPDTHQAMVEAMRRATDHINLGTYIFEEDAVGAKIANLLIDKVRAGVTVNLMYDGFGALHTPAEFFAGLRKVDMNICEFNPVRPFAAFGSLSVNNRNHRKILVVDGRVAFAGGVNVSEVYASSSAARRAVPPVEDGWRDTHLEIRGPVVADIQRLFLDAWREQCGTPAAADYFPRLQPAGDRLMRVIAGEPGRNEVYASLLSAIERAQARVYATVAYFAPDPRFVEALAAAAQRGVDVRLLLPGVTDSWAAHYAGRSHYALLLRAGVRLFELRQAMLHAKTAVIDGAWSTVGSANLDWRSFAHNHEVNVEILSVEFGRQMERQFIRDLRVADEISLARWERRGARSRLLEWVARQWEYLL